MGPVVDKIKDMGVRHVIAWHALCGFWGGLSDELGEQYEAELIMPDPPANLLVRPHGGWVQWGQGFLRYLSEICESRSSTPFRLVFIVPSRPSHVTSWGDGVSSILPPHPTTQALNPETAWIPPSVAGVRIPRDPTALHTDMHAYLAGCGVDGVKVDVQVGRGVLQGPAVGHQQGGVCLL